ncbi:MAG: methionyl-tRNA formyltransferase [Bacillota bacterium]|nr:methionyl-tRNA formyltransferase [Bacillota bacterium]
MRVMFMGTPEFAVPTLEMLVNTEQVVAVITQPDKPQGRRMTLTPPAVKVFAEASGIPVYQPQTLKDKAILPLLDSCRPELIVVVAYGKLLPEYVLNFPKYGCINVHASLLPSYRGAGPIQWAVINGEKETGVTTMYMAKGLDTGDIILKRAIEILPEETAGELHDRLMVLGADTMRETLDLVKGGDVPAQKQDDSVSSYAPMLDKNIASIDFSKTAKEVHDLIRGLNPWPIAYSFYRGKKIKVFTSFIDSNIKLEPSIAAATDKGIAVGCGDGQAIIFTEVQLEGGKRMSANLFLVGHSVEPNESLKKLEG